MDYNLNFIDINTIMKKGEAYDIKLYCRICPNLII